MKVIHQRTEHVTGYREKQNHSGGSKSGDPSPATAYGCYLGIKAAVKFKYQRDDIKGLRIGVQGLGNVGYRLAELLHSDGAVIVACDLDQSALAKAKQELAAEIVDLEDIYSQPLDVFAPCAMGATVNEQTLKVMNATIIAGSANNQLDTHAIGQYLHDQGILYAPDYVINAGGIIDVCYEHLGAYDAAKVNLHIEGIYDTLTELFERSATENRPTSELADTIAQERLNQGIPTLA
jgi:leucine dehydrogenase